MVITIKDGHSPPRGKSSARRKFVAERSVHAANVLEPYDATAQGRKDARTANGALQVSVRWPADDVDDRGHVSHWCDGAPDNASAPLYLSERMTSPSQLLRIVSTQLAQLHGFVDGQPVRRSKKFKTRECPNSQPAAPNIFVTYDGGREQSILLQHAGSHLVAHSCLDHDADPFGP